MNLTREEIKVNEIVGIRDNELVVLEYVFRDSDNFHGAVGYSMGVISQEYVDEQKDIDYLAEELGYLWREAVANEQTEEGLRDFMQGLVDNCMYSDNLYPMDDTSFRYETEKLVSELDSDKKAILEKYFGKVEDGVAYWSASGCGRNFKIDDEWQEVFRHDLVELIREYEQK